jgi:hypothetical protein
MTGRSDSDKIDPDRGNVSGRLIFGAALIFAVGATLTLVFATNAEWLKLAVIAALWAAFFGAMLSVKYRHQAAARAGEVADLQAVYELELEREVAARREYELEVEADTRRRIAEESEDSGREDIAALRTELRSLRENLERLTGGEVLVERFALRAQSTRMRAITDPLAASAIAADQGALRSITAGPSAARPNRAPGRTVDAVLDPSTELFEPAPRPQRPDSQRPDGQRQDGSRLDGQRSSQSADGSRRDGPTGQQRRPEPRVPTQSTGEQSRSNLRRDPINPPLPRQPGNTGAAPIMVRAAANTGPNPTVGRRPSDPGANSSGYRTGPDSRGYHSAETGADASGYRTGPDASGYRPGPDASGYRTGPDASGYHAGANASGYRSGDPDRRPGGTGVNLSAGRRSGDTGADSGRGWQPDDTGSNTRVGGYSNDRHPTDARVGGRPSGDSGAYPVGGRHPDHGGAHQIGVRPGDSGDYPVGGRHPDGSGPHPVSGRQPSPIEREYIGDADPGVAPTRFAASVARPASPPAAEPHHADSRHADSYHASHASHASSSRRRSPEPATNYDDDSFARGGRHESGSYEPVPRPVAAMSATPAFASAGARSGGRRTQPEPAGAHTAGRSVTELLAAHSSEEDSPRRHRRRRTEPTAGLG